MRRRSLLQSAALLPAAAALPSPASAQTAAPAPPAENFKLEIMAPDAVGQPVSRFFTQDQLAALRRLGELFVPPLNGRPGATEAGAAEFLDLHVSQSSAERQKLYRDGLDRVNGDARRFGKPFAEISADHAASIIKPVSEPWTYDGPSDPFGKFLLAAKEDLMRATFNSRAYSAAAAATSRGSAGMNYYWLPID